MAQLPLIPNKKKLILHSFVLIFISELLFFFKQIITYLTIHQLSQTFTPSDSKIGTQ